MGSLAELEYLAQCAREAASDGGEVAPDKLLRIASALREAARSWRRLAALGRAVYESAARGECVEIYGRPPGIVLVSYWREGDGCLEHVVNRPTLYEALGELAAAQEASDRG